MGPRVLQAVLRLTFLLARSGREAGLVASFIAAFLTNPNVRKGRLVRTGGQMVQLPQRKGPLKPDWHPLYL